VEGLAGLVEAFHEGAEVREGCWRWEDVWVERVALRALVEGFLYRYLAGLLVEGGRGKGWFEGRTLRSKTALPCRITESFSWPTQLQPRCGFACTGCAAWSLSSSGRSKNFLLCAMNILSCNGWNGRLTHSKTSSSVSSGILWLRILTNPNVDNEACNFWQKPSCCAWLPFAKSAKSRTGMSISN
jgi:hypothetical protein